MSTAAHAAAIGVTSGFSLSSRFRIQQEAIRDKKYIVIGRLLTVAFEGPRDISGLSQSRARYSNAKQAENIPDGMKPFSEKQAILWDSITLEWLSWRNGPPIAISHDRKDLLLPQGLGPLPDRPDPRWTPAHAFATCTSKTGCKGCIAPRIPQKLIGCPVVGDRVRDKITSRDGRVFGVIHPVNEMCVMLMGGQGGFARIRGGVDATDGTHLALLIDDEMNGFFAGGKFQLGG